jgi:hypothetical protein
MPVPRGHWQLPPVQLAALPPQPQGQIRAPLRLSPPGQFTLPVQARLLRCRLEPVRQAEAALVCHTRRAAEQWE